MKTRLFGLYAISARGDNQTTYRIVLKSLGLARAQAATCNFCRCKSKKPSWPVGHEGKVVKFCRVGTSESRFRESKAVPQTSETG